MLFINSRLNGNFIKRQNTQTTLDNKSDYLHFTRSKHHPQCDELHWSNYLFRSKNV